MSLQPTVCSDFNEKVVHPGSVKDQRDVLPELEILPELKVLGMYLDYTSPGDLGVACLSMGRIDVKFDQKVFEAVISRDTIQHFRDGRRMSKRMNSWRNEWLVEKEVYA